MAGVQASFAKGKPPSGDGAITEYCSPEGMLVPGWNPARRVIFINGMKNSPEDHAQSAMALSLVQLCPVFGVYNKSSGAGADLAQCIGDKNQFNGPLAGSTLKLTEAQARKALSRNACQVALFDFLRQPQNSRRELFAHSQGNLILSNVLQAIAAVDGPQAVQGRVVNTFGSPAVNWPSGISKVEQGFTFDPVTWLAGFDTSWSISKLGMPAGGRNPITHAFLLYLQNDPAFVVNRFRVGGWGLTFNMDEDGLAKCLSAMGANFRRVRAVFEHLDANHNADVDDVAVRYVQLVRKQPSVAAALKGDKALRELLIRVMDEGWTSADEKAAIAYLQAL